MQHNGQTAEALHGGDPSSSPPTTLPGPRMKHYLPNKWMHLKSLLPVWNLWLLSTQCSPQESGDSIDGGWCYYISAGLACLQAEQAHFYDSCFHHFFSRLLLHSQLCSGWLDRPEAQGFTVLLFLDKILEKNKHMTKRTLKSGIKRFFFLFYQ